MFIDVVINTKYYYLTTIVYLRASISNIIYKHYSVRLVILKNLYYNILEYYN